MMTPSSITCEHCGRQNTVDAQFCNNCGTALTKAAAMRTAVASGSGVGVATRDSDAPSAGSTPADAACPVCGSTVPAPAPAIGRTGDRRLIPDRRSHALTLVLLSELATEVARFDRKQSTTTIGRTEGDIRFPDDPFLSPLHAKLSWENDSLEIRDLGSRNGTWVFLEAPHLLTDGDVILIGSQMLRFRRLGYPAPHPPDADATRRMGSAVPSADIATLTQLRSDGSSRDVIQLSPGRDVHIGREHGDWIFPYDPSMSAQHATVRSEDADFVVVDDQSRNGIALAARGAMPLQHGSRIMVGDKVLRIELPGADSLKAHVRTLE